MYLTSIILSFSFFIFNLWLFFKSKVGFRYLVTSVAINTFVLIFAYPFLSSDLFNYLFDAKIILKYHVSPYTHRPLDFPQDEWLRFMRWTHRYSPYGPLWLAMSLIPATLGSGKFILNLLFFKIFIATFHLVNSVLIFKILTKINPKQATFGTAFYALNPLVLIEGVANAHNDIVLASFLILPIYLLIKKKHLKAIIALVFGVLVKYIPILNLPWLIWSSISKKKKNIQLLVTLNLITMAAFTYLFSSFRITVPFVSAGATQVQFQPWYLFWTLPFIALLPKFNLISIAIALSIGASLRYLPFLYYGEWSKNGTQEYMQFITLAPLLIVAVTIGYFKLIKSNDKAKGSK